MVASISSSAVSDWSNALFSKLDTKNQGYIDKADIEAAFAKTTGSGAADGASSSTSNGTSTSAADQLFTQLDSDKDGKVSKSELSAAVAKVADELNAQFDQARVAKGKGGPPPQREGAPSAGGTSGSTGSTSTSTATTSYNAAADTNGDGTVSADEAAAYAKLVASGAVGANVDVSA